MRLGSINIIIYTVQIALFFVIGVNLKVKITNVFLYKISNQSIDDFYLKLFSCISYTQIPEITLNSKAIDFINNQSNTD